MVRSLRIFAAWIATVAMAWPVLASEPVVLEFRLTASGHMILPLSIAGAPPREAVIDTGANHAFLDSGHVAAAGIELPPPEAPKVNVLGIAGIQPYPATTIPHASVDGVQFDQFPAALHDSSSFPGPTNILPAIAFDHRILDFDFPERRLMLYDGKPSPVKTIRSRLDIREINEIWFVRVKLNRRQGWAMIDSGSNVTYVNSAFADTAAPRHRAKADAFLDGSTDGDALARIVRVNRLNLGDHSLSDFELLVADPPLFEHLGLDGEPAMVLGLDALRHFRMQVDQQQGRLYLSVPGRRHQFHDGKINPRDLRRFLGRR